MLMLLKCKTGSLVCVFVLLLIYLEAKHRRNAKGVYYKGEYLQLAVTATPRLLRQPQEERGYLYSIIP